MTPRFPRTCQFFGEQFAKGQAEGASAVGVVHMVLVRLSAPAMDNEVIRVRVVRPGLAGE